MVATRQVRDRLRPGWERRSSSVFRSPTYGPDEPHSPSPAWNAVAAALGAVALAIVLAMVVEAWRGCPSTGLIGALGGHRASWSVALCLVSGTGALACLLVPRRRTLPQRGVVVTSVLVVVTVVAAFPAYLTIDSGGASPWPAVGWTLAIFVGNVAGGFAQSECGAATPLAIQFASVTGLASLLLAVGGLVAAATSTTIDRLFIRTSSRIILVVEVEDEHGCLLVETLLRDREAGTCCAVLLRDPGSPYVGRLRAAGARVVVTPKLGSEDVRRLVARQSAHRIVAAYLLSAAAATNRSNARTIEQVCSDHPRRGSVARLVVRVDSPMQAEDLRRRPPHASFELLTDTTGLHQVTAQEIIDRAVHAGRDVLVISGHSELALALLDEVQQHAREVAAQGRTDDIRLRSVVVTGPGSADIIADHEHHQRRHGNEPLIRVESDPADDLVEVVGRRLADGRLLVVVADLPTEASYLVAARTAARHEAAQVVVWVEGLDGVARDPATANLREVGLTLLATRQSAHGRWRRSLPEDGWIRVARRLHEQHLARGRPQGRPRDRPWDELPTFYRNSNLRQISMTMRMAQRPGGPGPGRPTIASQCRSRAPRSPRGHTSSTSRGVNITSPTDGRTLKSGRNTKGSPRATTHSSPGRSSNRRSIGTSRSTV
jgi:hypothetical protein